MSAKRRTALGVARFAGFGLLALSILHSAMAQAQQYTLTDLGTLGGQNSYGTGINATGEVVGYSSYTAENAEQHAFLYSKGSMQDLGTLGGTYSVGYGINAAGQVTGTAYTAGNAMGRAFLYSNGSMQDLGTLGGTSVNAYSPQSVGFGINAAGQVTGYSYIAGDLLDEHAFLYNNGSMQDLQGLVVGYAINATGQVVGDGFTQYAQHAFLYSNGLAQDLGTLGGGYSGARGINATGQVTGFATTVGNASDAFLYSNGSMQDLGTLGGTVSVGYGINATGQVTGYSYIAGDTAEHAFLYSNGKMTDLNTLVTSSPLAKYVTLVTATAINDNGWIVANSADGKGLTHAYLLTPVKPPTITTSLAPSSSPTTDANGDYVVTLLISNTGEVTASAAEISAATLVVNQNGKAVDSAPATPLPAALGDLTPGASATLALTFPASAGLPGSMAALRWSLADSTGSAGGTLRLVLP
jgi:probable HAF family extracellular repeat protein